MRGRVSYYYLKKCDLRNVPYSPSKYHKRPDSRIIESPKVIQRIPWKYFACTPAPSLVIDKAASNSWAFRLRWNYFGLDLPRTEFIKSQIVMNRVRKVLFKSSMLGSSISSVSSKGATALMTVALKLRSISEHSRNRQLRVNLVRWLRTYPLVASPELRQLPPCHLS